MSLDTTKNDLQDLQTILSKIDEVSSYVKVFNVEDNITSDIQKEFSNEVRSDKSIQVEFYSYSK